ncbi:MAG: hypothetical protein KF805_05585 [Phycisphaeraceae bacterium]|nr:hypothetical protein [Phycisphaeraceae bacterium]
MMIRNRCRGMGAVVSVGALALASSVISSRALADDAVIPSSGNGVELGLSNQGTLGGNSARRFMMVIDAQALTGIPLGSTLTGFHVRLDNSNTTAWPPSNVAIADYEMRISAAATTAATMSSTFADNISGVQTLVMDGALQIPSNSYGASASGTTPEAFGPTISFDSGFLYLGGSLCLDINYTGTGLVAAEFMDTSSTVEGMASCFAISRTATTGGVGNGNVLKFEYTPPSNTIVPAVFASTEAPSGQEGPFGGTTNRRFQYVVDESALGIPAGAKILGMVFRQDDFSSGAWPGTAFTFSDYEVRLSQGVSTGAMTTTYADNVIGSQTLVVNGALPVNVRAFQGERTPPTPEQFGRVIMFQSPYQYLGGNLCVDINHPGTGLVAAGYLDSTMSGSFAADGVRGLYSNVSRTAATGNLVNAPVTRFIYSADLRHGVTKVYVPEEYASAEAPLQLNSMTNSASRSIMTVAGTDQFDTVAPGSRVVGHSGRLGSGLAAWPPADAVFASYKIDISRSVNPPGALSTTFANNVGTDVVHAYDNALVIPANAFKAASNAPFSHTFWYQNGYPYTGGPLNTFVRHSGNGNSSQGFMDAVPPEDPAYGVRTDCLFEVGNAAVTGAPIAAPVLRHEVDAATTVPLSFGSVGTSHVAGLLRFDEYSYQMVIGADELRYIPVGSLIDSMWVRNYLSGAQSPTGDSICPDFELTLSTAARSPSTMSTTFATNEGTDKVRVHDGPLGVPAGSMPAGSTNSFGRIVQFQKAFVYKGGNLCVTVRHQQFTEDVARCDISSSTLPGARSVFGAAFGSASGSYLGGVNGGAIATARFGYVPSVMTPNAFATLEANNGFDFFSGPSTVQIIVPASELLPIDVGSAITGMSLRNSATGFAPTFPAAALAVSRFDVTLAPAARTPLTMSNTFATNNGPGVVAVREGPMVMPGGAFPASEDFVAPGENAWFIDFERAYIYGGGDLCLTMRTTATLPAFSYLDAEITPSSLGAGRWNDGDADAASSASAVGAVAVRFAFTARAFCPWDLNNDGIVEDADFPIFLNAYNILDCADGSMPFGCPADFNHDGVVDDADFQLFVVAYNTLLCP